MFKARAGGVLVVGLSDENLERLRKGQSIVIHRHEVDNHEPIEQVLLFSKPTEREMFEYLKAEGLIAPDQEYVEVPSYKDKPLN